MGSISSILQHALCLFSFFPQPDCVAAGDHDEQHGAAGLDKFCGSLPEYRCHQIREGACFGAKHAAAIDKHMACDAGPQAAAFVYNNGIEKTDHYGIANLQQDTQRIRCVGQIYDMSCAECYCGNDDRIPQIVLCHSTEQETAENHLFHITSDGGVCHHQKGNRNRSGEGEAVYQVDAGHCDQGQKP